MKRNQPKQISWNKEDLYTWITVNIDGKGYLYPNQKDQLLPERILDLQLKAARDYLNAAIQNRIMENKNSSNPIPYQELSLETQKWYAKDKGKTIQLEFLL